MSDIKLHSILMGRYQHLKLSLIKTTHYFLFPQFDSLYQMHHRNLNILVPTPTPHNTLVIMWSQKFINLWQENLFRAKMYQIYDAEMIKHRPGPSHMYIYFDDSLFVSESETIYFQYPFLFVFIHQHYIAHTFKHRSILQR